MLDFDLKLIQYVMYNINNIRDKFLTHLSRSEKGGWVGALGGVQVSCSQGPNFFTRPGIGLPFRLSSC